MITNNEIKYVKSLAQRKFRQKYNKFIAEGDKICSDLLLANKYEIDTIYCLNDWYQQNEGLLAEYKEVLKIASNKDLERMSALKTPNKVLIVATVIDEALSPNGLVNTSALYLADIQNPGNVGTIIRIADWYGIKHIIRSSQTADFYSPKVIQATMASFANVNLYTMDFHELKSNLNNHTFVGADLSGDDIRSYEWKQDSIIVMGNEGNGLSSDILNNLDDNVKILGDKDRLADSLNVSIATALICQSWFSR